MADKVMQASKTIDPNVHLSRSEYVGPAVGEELVESGVLAIVVSLIAILAYIAFRFEWRMATGAVISGPMTLLLLWASSPSGRLNMI